MTEPVPVTVETENESEIVPSTLNATSPPRIEPGSPVTAPLDQECEIVPAFMPASPPAMLGSAVTAPVANESTI
jgi:hypothetical protein